MTRPTTWKGQEDGFYARPTVKRSWLRRYYPYVIIALLVLVLVVMRWVL